MPTDFFYTLPPNTQEALRLIGSILLFLWLFGNRRRLLKKLIYATKGIYWKLKKFVWWLLRLLTPHYHIRPQKTHYRMSRRVTRKDLENLYHSISQGPFKPWRIDYFVAFVLWGIGIVWLCGFIFWYLQTQNLYILACAMFCVAPIYVGFSNQESGQRRRHGKNVENIARKSFIKACPNDWDVFSEQLLKECGDIDILVRLANDQLCVIEVKSWHRWTGIIRTANALHQIFRQKLIVGASYSAIWLPHAVKPNVTNLFGSLIVEGSAHFLIDKIKENIWHKVTVRFPSKPPHSVRAYLKHKTYKYDQASRAWNGFEREKNITETYNNVFQVGGEIDTNDE